MTERDTSIIDEQLLLKRCVEGERTAFTILYMHYTPLLYRLLYPLTNESRQDAEEIIQDIFLSIWEKREMLMSIQSFRPFVFRMARNRVIDRYRKSATQKKLEEGIGSRADGIVSSPADDLLYIQYHTIALRAIEALPPRQREIFKLRTCEEMSLNDIAEHLDISLSAVKKQLYAAILSVKTYLRNEGEWLVILLLFFKGL